MTLETTTYFKSLCDQMDITSFPSSLGPNLLKLEEVDFWIFANSKKDFLGAPINLFEVGNSIVVHFYVKKEKEDLQLEVIPKHKVSFLQLLEDLRKNASL
ncbi:MAG: hypothetical protein VX642_12665 [Bdellovibrionota bacterium]|nr:hypothetical protein [Bdellovibrionota bacterium]